MGTQLQCAGLPVGTPPEEWNLSNPQAVKSVHTAYLNAGADIILSNTFGVNPLKYGGATGGLISSAVKIAKSAVKDYKDKYVALDIGPTGKLLKPLGELGFESAVDCFKQVVKEGVRAGADLIFIETMNDIYEAKAAMLAAKETCDLPVFVSMVFGADSKTMTGCSPQAAVAVLEGLGADAVGLNCSLCPADMRETVKAITECASIPVIVKPNAGLPKMEGGEVVYQSAQSFAEDMRGLIEIGARCVGGCCGTSPEHIRELCRVLEGARPQPLTDKKKTVISSYTHALYLGDRPVLIGERINPTGKKKLKQAILEGDMAYILGEAVTQTERGAHALDVNVGLPEIDEGVVLKQVVQEIQTVTNLPLQIDSSDISAMEGALRVYNGKPLINSVNGKEESMNAVFPLVKKYGGAVIALTLDEEGIPATAEGRIAIAKKILKRAKSFGICSKDIIFDTLAMAVSADESAGQAVLNSLSYIKNKLGVNTSLGVSNISFGLPDRDFFNCVFFSEALQLGLSAAIMNPNSDNMLKTYYSHLVLSGKDNRCLDYISFISQTQPQVEVKTQSAEHDLKYCIVKGLRDGAAEKAKQLLRDLPPLEIIDGYVIPALDEVGKAFENKTMFLPQLLMSAECASGAFGVIKDAFGEGAPSKKLKVVLATVKGDIHDIGKNIVRTLLENYGFTVIDLGRDVEAQTVVDAALKHGAKLVGLSALMTTTVGAMESTVRLVHEQCSGCKVIVGGAVLNSEYADRMGADAYGKDAMSTVRYALEIEESL